MIGVAGIFGGDTYTIDYMSVDDLFALTVAQKELAELLREGKTYKQMKAIVMQAYTNPSGRRQRRSLLGGVADKLRPYFFDISE